MLYPTELTIYSNCIRFGCNTVYPWNSKRVLFTLYHLSTGIMVCRQWINFYFLFSFSLMLYWSSMEPKMVVILNWNNASDRYGLRSLVLWQATLFILMEPNRDWSPWKKFNPQMHIAPVSANHPPTFNSQLMCLDSQQVFREWKHNIVSDRVCLCLFHDSLN